MKKGRVTNFQNPGFDENLAFFYENTTKFC